MGLLETPRPVGDRPRERAPHVPEHLRLEQRLGNRPAVERDEALLAARAVLVNGAGHELLPRARLPRDQDGAGRHRHRLEHLEQVQHRLAAADDAVEAIAGVELRAEVGVLRLQAALLEGRREDVQQVLELDRLRHEVARALLDGGDRVRDRAVARDHDHHDLVVAVPRRLDDDGSVDARQPQVGDDDVEGEFGQPFERGLAAGRLHHLVPVVAEPARGQLPQHALVLDQQQVNVLAEHQTVAANMLAAGTPAGQARPASRKLGTTAPARSSR